MANQTIGDRIKVVRERADLTRWELGAKVGVAESKIARWEGGKQEPRLDDVARLAIALGVERLWLAWGERQAC